MVGGAVRDMLLGLPVQDHDWVVVGSTPDELVALGYLPVGKDFPVFLHPETKEEYALARTERKTARGYHGFEVHTAPDVTLEQDLARRDLTINSIAARPSIDWDKAPFDADLTALIDPFGGQQDIQAKVLRHVTDAFREDPVRILRVARFAARFADFSVAPETMHLMRRMVADGEADALVPERVWQELSRGLMEGKPSRMLDVLAECGALDTLLKPLQLGSDSNLIVDDCANSDAPLAVRYACLVASGQKQLVNQLVKQLESDPNLFSRVPVECQELALLLTREFRAVDESTACDAAALTTLLQRCDAFRKPQRFANLLLACQCMARGGPGQREAAYPQRQHLADVLKAAQSVVTSVIAEAAIAEGQDGKKIGERVHAARVAAVARFIS